MTMDLCLLSTPMHFALGRFRHLIWHRLYSECRHHFHHLLHPSTDSGSTCSHSLASFAPLNSCWQSLTLLHACIFQFALVLAWSSGRIHRRPHTATPSGDAPVLLHIVSSCRISRWLCSLATFNTLRLSWNQVLQELAFVFRVQFASAGSCWSQIWYSPWSNLADWSVQVS